MIRCVDGSLYTGTARDPQARFIQHIKGTGARYTRSHRPHALVYTEAYTDRSSACKREAELKRYTKLEKEKVVSVYIYTSASRKTREAE